MEEASMQYSSLPVIATLSFVISPAPACRGTGAERSLCGCLFLEIFFDGAKPTCPVAQWSGSLLKVEPSYPEDRRIQHLVTFVKVSSINLDRGPDSSPGV
ncbi:MAG: hypothetical protein QOE55_4956 [Acidobacteriaceae bacterium]|jgi:hypothetical protein|nr:hypothetical protein [Acidobacteriaceae bacterium]